VLNSLLIAQFSSLNLSYHLIFYLLCASKLLLLALHCILSLIFSAHSDLDSGFVSLWHAISQPMEENIMSHDPVLYIFCPLYTYSINCRLSALVDYNYNILLVLFLLCQNSLFLDLYQNFLCSLDKSLSDYYIFDPLYLSQHSPLESCTYLKYAPSSNRMLENTSLHVRPT
jgi:hypothetical protein